MGVRQRGIPAAIAVGLALALSACGTTVPGAEQLARESNGGVSNDGLSASNGALEGGTDTTAPVTDSTLASGGATRTPSTATSRTPSTTAEKTAAPKGPVIVGVHYLKGVNQLASALGIQGLSTGDAVAQATALANDLNARGGLGGRPIKLVSYGAQLDEPAQQTACTALTQDLGARIIVSYFQLPASAIACYAKAGAVIIDNLGEVDEQGAARGKGSFYAPGDFLKGRLNAALIESLVTSGWLDSKSTVGIYSYSDASNQYVVDKFVRPALAKHNIKVAISGFVSRDTSGVSENSGLVLKFRAAGVDRVIPVSTSPLFFMQSANSQGYRPRYAVTSGVGPGALLETSAPKGQLVGAAGLGYQPYSDIGKGTRPAPVSANQTRCLKIMNDAGLPADGAVTLLAQMSMCESFFFMAAVLANHPAADIAAFAAGASELGPSYPSAITFQSNLLNGRPDGASAYRELRYDEGCECFQYVSGVKPA